MPGTRHWSRGSGVRWLRPSRDSAAGDSLVKGRLRPRKANPRGEHEGSGSLISGAVHRRRLRGSSASAALLLSAGSLKSRNRDKMIPATRGRSAAMKVGVIGLGNMGMGAALNLLKKG